MQIRMMTSMIRHHTIILKPMTAYLQKGTLLNEAQIHHELDEFVAQARRITAGRLLTYASRVEHLKYNPVGYVLSAMKDAEDEKMKRRREMIEARMDRARQAVELRVLPPEMHRNEPVLCSRKGILCRIPCLPSDCSGAEKQAAVSAALAWPERNFLFVSDQRVIDGWDLPNVKACRARP